jgi:hypothetical protein
MQAASITAIVPVMKSPKAVPKGRDQNLLDVERESY